MKLNVSVLVFGLSLSYPPSSESSDTIRVNGHEIIFEDEVESVFCEAAEGTNHIAFKIEGDDILVGNFSDSNALKETSLIIYNDFIRNDEAFFQQFSEEDVQLSNPEIEIEGTHLNGKKNMILIADKKLYLKNSRATIDQKITLTSSQLDIDNFFITTPNSILLRNPERDSSWLLGIKFTPFPSDAAFTYYITGTLSFSPPTTQDFFLVMGAKKVKFYLTKQ